MTVLENVMIPALASKDTAAHVNILGTHLRSAHNKLPGACISRRREGREHTELEALFSWQDSDVWPIA
jgi:hypothetical protein